MSGSGILGLLAILGLALVNFMVLGQEFLSTLPTQNLPSDYASQKDQNPRRVDETGRWLLDSPQFKQWLSPSHTSLLHVTADPGWGKSVLSRYVLEETFPIDQDGPLVLYFFFKKGQGKQDRAETAVAAMIHQFWTQTPHIESGFPFPNIQSTDYEPDHLLDDLWTFFLRHARYAGNGIVCVIDGLDECQEEGREKLIALMLDFVSSATIGWAGSFKFNKFIVLSRPDLEIDFEIDHPSGNRPFIRLNGSERSKVMTDELDTLINVKVLEMLPMVPLEIRESIILRLRAAENKTSLWLQLVLDHIKTIVALEESEQELEYYFKQLPLSLDQTYDAMLKRNRNDEDKKALLSIIAAARRPLTIGEVQMAFKISRTEPNDIRKMSDIELESDEQFEQILQNLCGSVLRVHERKVFFVHETARQFVLSQEESSRQNSSSWRGSVDMASAEALLSRVCLIMLSLEDFDGPVPWIGAELDKWDFYEQHSEWIDQRPLFEYAGTNWVHHYRVAEHTIYPTLCSTAWKLTDQSSPAFQNWQSMFMAEEEYCSYNVTHNLALFARLGFYTIVEQLLDEGADFDASDRRLGTALSAASRHGHDHVVRLLLKRGARVSGPGNPGLKAVEAATEGAHEGIVRLLFESGAHGDAKEDYSPALGAAIRKSHIQIVRLLLEYGADANSQFEWECTALVSAVSRANRPIAQLLVESGADINARAKGDGALLPLHAAVAREDEDMMRLLLELGASVDDVNGRNSTALWFALGRNNEKMMRLLLEHGASVEPHLGGWELESFYVENAKELVRLLLQHGLDASGRFGVKILVLAAKDGIWEIVELLKDHGADLNIRNKRGETLLHRAVKDQKIRLVEVLLKHGGDVHARSERGATPLHLIAAADLRWMGDFSSQFIAEMLLERGADPNARDDNGATPLHLAADHSQAPVVRALVMRGADARARWRRPESNGGTTTALHVAVAPTHGLSEESGAETVKLLLEHGAEVDAREDDTDATSLHLAMDGLWPPTGRLLVQYGANVTARRRLSSSSSSSIADEGHHYFPKGETPLLAAAYQPPYLSRESEYVEVVQLLIERGAEPDDYDADGRNALLAAAYSNNVVMAWVLLESRLELPTVDVHARDADGLTSLMLAARSLLDDIPRMLLANGARVDDRDPKGRTAVDFARERGSDAVVECLLEYYRYVEHTEAAARAEITHPIPLSDPRERLRLKLTRAIERDRKRGEGKPEPTPLYCGGSTTDLSGEQRLDDGEEEDVWFGSIEL